ncbi:MAG: hypothetical protein LAT61_00910 [Alcanivorax sp.]|nr:hypothetical protein [Alcanivorax sp.]
MNGWLSRSALLAALALVLAACGGSSTEPTAAPGGSGAPGSSDQPLLTVVDTNNEFSIAFCPNTASMGTIGELIDRIACENEALQGISAADADVLGLFCPEAADGFSLIGVSEGENGNTASVLPLDFGPACLAETAETLQNIQSLLGNNPLTAALCPIAAMQSDFDPAGCFTEAASMFSDFTPPSPSALIDIVGEICPVAALGPIGPTTPVECLTEVGESLANAQELLLGPNLITVAVCPVAAMAEEFDPAACISETAGAFIPGGGGGFDGLPGFDQLPGIGELCDPDSDPLACLLALGDQLAPLLELADGIPVLGDILDAILGGGEGGPGGDIPELPGFDACDPTDPAGCLSALTELLAPLTDIIGQIPVLGDIINGLLSGELPEAPGGGDGGLPEFPGFGDTCDPADPASCLALLTDALAPLSDALSAIPVLGDIIAGILSGELPEAPGGGDGGLPAFPGFDDCDPTDPIGCLGALTDLLAPLTGALDQIPVLGDIINGILSGELPEAPGGGDGGLPEFPGFGDCDPTDPAGCLSALTDLLAPLSDALAQIPVLGDIVNGILSGDLPEAPGGGGFPELPGFDACDPADPASCLAVLTDALAPLSDALGQIPVLGDIVNGLLAGEVPDFPGFPGGGDGDGGFPELPGFDACDPTDPASCLAALAGLADMLEPLTGLLEEIPVLGDLIVGLLSGELPDFPGGDGGLPGGDFGDFCDPADPASCLALLTDALGPVTDGLSAIPVLGDVLGTLLGAVDGGDTSGIEDIPVLGAILGPIFGFLP